MTSAGSFVHGGDGRTRTNTNSDLGEQDIADFLSSIDEITSNTSGTIGSSAAGVTGATADATGASFLRGGSSASGDLFFGPTPPSRQESGGNSNSLLLGGVSDGDMGNADPAPAEWFKDLQSLQAGRDEPAAETLLGLPTADDNDRNQKLERTQPRSEMHEHVRDAEVLGMEPEIIDDLGYAFDGTNLSMGMDNRTGGTEILGWRKQGAASTDSTAWVSLGSRRNANDDPPTYPRGDGREDVMKPSHVGGDATRTTADELLDWPGTLDMLGMADADNSGSLPATSTTTGVPVSEFPTMPAPAARKEKFADFVEIRDPRNVSQFPKPDNAFAAKAGSSSGGDRGGEDDKAVGEGRRATTGELDQAAAGQRQVQPTPVRTVEVYLRPDVTWESVSDVYMAVMLSGGLVVRRQTEKTVLAEKTETVSGDWASVKLTVGVTRDKLRTLVIQFYADSKAPMLSLAGTMARFSGRTGDGLYTAIRDALVERRVPLSFLDTDAHEVSLDPHYVRDLVGMYAHENMVNLTRYALPLEEFVRREEERSARLEATLLPQYRAFGLRPPRPTRSKSLAAYPLTTRRPPVSSCGVEDAREVMERARERVYYSDEGAAAAAGNAGDGGERKDSVVEGIRSLIRATWEDVKEWCDEEAEARVRRKDSQVRDRLLAVERHRENLIKVLRDSAGGSAAAGTPGGREFAARFRPMAEEAVLCQCKAMHAKRVGQLYLTCNHICFYSSVLGFTSQRVVPLLTVVSISHTASALGMDIVTLSDHGGEAHSFGITAVEAGFPQRFHDLLKQCLVLCKAEASRRAAKEGAAKPNEPDEEQILAKVQRLAKAKNSREAREAAAAFVRDAAAAKTPPAPTAQRLPPSPVSAPPTSTPPPYRRNRDKVVKRDEADKADGVADVGGVVEREASGEIGLGNSSETGATTAGKDSDRQEDGGSGWGVGASGGGRNSGGSMMAMGIQAFLQESQKRS